MYMNILEDLAEISFRGMIEFEKFLGINFHFHRFDKKKKNKQTKTTRNCKTFFLQNFPTLKYVFFFFQQKTQHNSITNKMKEKMKMKTMMNW